MKFAIWSNCHEMKNKRFDWILTNKCSHPVWPWLWPWPWIFKVNFWNSPISGIERPIDTEQSGVIHDHDRDLFVTKMRCKELPDSDQIMFSLHSVSCKKTPTSQCIKFFLLYTATHVRYITEYEPCKGGFRGGRTPPKFFPNTIFIAISYKNRIWYLKAYLKYIVFKI